MGMGGRYGMRMGGVGTVGEIHDKIERELVDRAIVKVA
jgi:hypothetical protein